MPGLLSTRTLGLLPTMPGLVLTLPPLLLPQLTTTMLGVTVPLVLHGVALLSGETNSIFVIEATKYDKGRGVY